MLRAYLLLCLSLFAVPVIAATEIRSNEVWLLIDTKEKKIEVKKVRKQLKYSSMLQLVEVVQV